MVYGIFLVLPLALHWLMFRTRHGMNMRAVGEKPSAVDAAGIPVMRFRFWYVALAAGSGTFLSLAFVPF